MSSCIAHRGPDSDGVWLDADLPLALGHRRLAIVDLSPTGAQPMSSASGRFVIVLNGEIYNYRPLRKQLADLGHQFRGASDTEVLLAGIEEWGLQRTLERCAGMFAIALWDRAERQLSLARDRMGEKPLYVARPEGALLFSSELKAFRSFPGWRGVVNREALAEYLRFGYVPTRFAIFDGVDKVAPGTIRAFSLNDAGDVTADRTTRYWSASDVMTSGSLARFTTSPTSLIDELDGVLRTTVSEEMVADVPLGAFLSGGIDSSLIVALMQNIGSRPVRTFSIGFDIADYNEAQHARLVADHLGTEHTEYYVSASEAMQVIQRLPSIYDEPFADSSQIPTFLVSQLARRHVTVALSGDGGDEVFGGYNRYAWIERIWNRMQRMPKWARRAAASTMTKVSPVAWDSVGRAVGTIAPSLRARTYGDKVHKLARLLSLDTQEALYEEIVSAWSPPSKALAVGMQGHSHAVLQWPDAGLTFTEQMMLADMVSYLPDDILVKVDRAAMAVSLETRAPFIDHRVVEFAARLPFAMKVNQGIPKWILRELLDRYVPRHLVDRPKMGFGVPLHAWLREELRPWAEQLLAPERLESEGFFNPAAVQAQWRAHLAGRVNAVPLLWPILMFEMWLQEQP